MPEITLATASLEEIDRLKRNLLILTFFSDERPLVGLNGLADWRYRGRLSSLIEEKQLTGTPGERTLMTSSRRIDANRVLLYGLGPLENFDNMIYTQTVEDLVGIAVKMKAESLAICIPGAHRNNEFLLERMAILIKELCTKYDGRVTLFIGKQYNLKEMQAKFDLIKNEVEKVLAQVVRGSV